MKDDRFLDLYPIRTRKMFQSFNAISENNALSTVYPSKELEQRAPT
jgi:hypothetical protein